MSIIPLSLTTMVSRIHLADFFFPILHFEFAKANNDHENCVGKMMSVLIVTRERIIEMTMIVYLLQR